jgi:LAO/AO transport system kinase
MRKRLSLSAYLEGILSGDRVVLSQAITLTESSRADDRELADRLLEAILPHTGKAVRLGITGAPGVGKSSFIEAFGTYLTAQNHRVAVLAIDPSSRQSGGSILGDKTRMETLARNPKAYIRPTPSGLTLGGVARQTRETLLLCEAAGFDIILIETVGVGQSETEVRDMTDCFFLLLLAGAGDELQGVKRGIMELADFLLITKDDGDNRTRVETARRDYAHALHFLAPPASGWTVPVLPCSIFQEESIENIWKQTEEYLSFIQKNGFFSAQRERQNLSWMHAFIRQQLEAQFYANPLIQRRLQDLEEQVRKGTIPPLTAAKRLFSAEI